MEEIDSNIIGLDGIVHTNKMRKLIITCIIKSILRCDRFRQRAITLSERFIPIISITDGILL